MSSNQRMTEIKARIDRVAALDRLARAAFTQGRTEAGGSYRFAAIQMEHRVMQLQPDSLQSP